jgi:Low molecular weight phosphotyrosine protein phosphatase
MSHVARSRSTGLPQDCYTLAIELHRHMADSNPSSVKVMVLVVCLGTSNHGHRIRVDNVVTYNQLGNICRSPMGEAVLRDVATKRGLDITVDSCGTAGYHEGEDPDDR